MITVKIGHKGDHSINFKKVTSLDFNIEPKSKQNMEILWNWEKGEEVKSVASIEGEVWRREKSFHMTASEERERKRCHSSTNTMYMYQFTSYTQTQLKQTDQLKDIQVFQEKSTIWNSTFTLLFLLLLL